MDTDKLAQLLSKNLAFHALVENEVAETPYGQITFNLVIKNGVVDMSSLNIVRNRRLRYSGSVD